MVFPAERTSGELAFARAVPPRKLPALVRGFLVAILLLTAVSTLGELACHYILGCGYPYDSPFVAPVSRFDDLLDWLPRFASLHTEAFFTEQPPVVYPAPMSMLYGVWRLLGRAALPAYLALAALTAFAAGALLFGELRRRGVRFLAAIGVFAVLLGTSYPFWFLVYTANLELVVFLLLASGLLLFCRRRLMAAAVFFALATSLKWTPALFFLLFLRRRHLRSLLAGVALAIGVTVASLWGVYPNLDRSWQATQAGARLFIVRDGLHKLAGQLGFDHSLFALLKFLDPFATPPSLAGLWHVLGPLSGLAVLALWFGRMRRLPLPEQVLFLTVCMVWLPPVSYDYTLMELYLPAALLLRTVLGQGEILTWRSVKTALACFAILLTPQGYLILHGVRCSGQVKSVALGGLLITAVAGFRKHMSATHSHFLQPSSVQSVL